MHHPSCSRLHCGADDDVWWEFHVVCVFVRAAPVGSSPLGFEIDRAATTAVSKETPHAVLTSQRVSNSQPSHGALHAGIFWSLFCLLTTIHGRASEAPGQNPSHDCWRGPWMQREDFWIFPFCWIVVNLFLMTSLVFAVCERQLIWIFAIFTGPQSSRGNWGGRWVDHQTGQSEVVHQQLRRDLRDSPAGSQHYGGDWCCFELSNIAFILF